MDANPLEGMSVKEIEKALVIAKKNLKLAFDEVEAYELELERRELDAYWAAHPELTPIDVKTGDDLQTVDWYSSLEWDKGDHVTVYSISVSGNVLGYWIQGNNGNRICIKDIEQVAKMRQAYLDDADT